MYRVIFLVLFLVCHQKQGMSQVIDSSLEKPADSGQAQGTYRTTSSFIITTPFLLTGKYQTLQSIRLKNNTFSIIFKKGPLVDLNGEVPLTDDPRYIHPIEFEMNGMIKKMKRKRTIEEMHLEELLRPFFMQNIFK